MLHPLRTLDSLTTEPIRQQAFSTIPDRQPLDLTPPEGVAVFGLEVPGVDGRFRSWLYRPENSIARVAIVATHGLSSNVAQIRPYIEAGKLLGIPVLGFTTRDHDGAPVLNKYRASFGGDNLAEGRAAIDYVINNEIAENVLLGGISHGGAIALSLAFNDRKRVDRESVVAGLLLMAPASNIESIIHDQVQPTLVRMYRKARGRSIEEPLIPIAEKGQRNAIAHLLGKYGTMRIARQDRVNWQDLNFVARSKDELVVPTLVLHGQKDDLVPIGYSRELRDLNPDLVVLEEFADHTHVGQWEDPKQNHQYVQKIVDFVRGTC